MSTIVTRSGKGSPLTHNEVDTNFTNLNTDKVEKTSADITGGTINNTTIGATTPSTGVFTTLTAQTELLRTTGNNLFARSQTFNGTWTAGGANITATDNAVTAPDSTTTAANIVPTVTNGLHRISNPTTLTLYGGVTYTSSIYAKANGYRYLFVNNTSGIGAASVFDLQTGTVSTSTGSATITSAGSGWYRCTVTGVASSSGVPGLYWQINNTFAVGDQSFAGDGTSSIYFWGGQLEIGSSATTYVPTTTAGIWNIPSLSFGSTSAASIGLQSDGSLYETSAGTGNVRFYTNNIGQEQARVSHTTSAVNYMQFTGAVTGGNVQLSAQGSDSSVGISLVSKGGGGSVWKGDGGVYFQNNAANNLFSVENTASTVNRLTATGGVTGSGPRLFAQGSDTNIPLVLSPKGTGALQAQQTDSTATGGNARGANAVDWQTNRGAAGQVASGQYAVVAGGSRNQSSGDYSFTGSGFNNSNQAYMGVIAGGQNNTNQGTYSFVGGGQLNSAQGIYTVIGGGWTNTGTGQAAVTTQSATANATTTITLGASNASIKVGQYISGTYISGQTYVAAISGTTLTLSQTASGSGATTLSFFTPHGVVVGGGNNIASGSYSYIGGGGDAGTAANRNVASGDWSVVGGGSKNVASGAGSVIAGGGLEFGSSFGNTASGSSSFVGGGILNTSTSSGSTISGGWQNIANGVLSTVVGGRHGNTRGITGNIVFPACSVPVVDDLGVSQAALLVLGRQTTDATATRLTSDSGAASTINQVIMPNNTAYFFTGEIISGVTGGGNTKGWTIEGVIKRGANAASTALVGTPTVTSMYADVGAATWAIAVTADTTNGGLAVTFTGQAATTIRTVAQIRTTEMTY